MLGALRNKFGVLVPLLLCTLPLLLGAFFNRYPFLESDSAYYIFYASEYVSTDSPVFRPLTYVIFVFAGVLAGSAWVTILLQCLLLSYALCRFVERQQGEIKIKNIFLATLAACLFTPVLWHSGIVMPDILTPALVLLLPGLITFQERRQFGPRTVMDLFLVVLCASAHISNVFLIGFVSIFAAVFFGSRRDYLRAFALVCLPLLVLSSDLWLHKYLLGRAVLSDMPNISLLTKLQSIPEANAILREECRTEKKLYCGLLEPSRAPAAFFWEGVNPRIGTLEERRAWDRDGAHGVKILEEKLPLGILLRSAAEDFSTQLRTVSFTSVQAVARVSGALTFSFGEKEMERFRGSRLAENKINFLAFERFYSWSYFCIWIFSFAAIVWAWRKKDKSALALAYLMGVILVNAAICGIFSEPLGRYNGRLAWVLLFALVVFLLKTIQSGKFGSSRLA